MLFGKFFARIGACLIGSKHRGSSMSELAPLQQDGAVQFASPNLSLIDIIDDEEENVGADYSSGMPRDGSRNRPILVTPFRNGQGSKNEPIFLDEEFMGDTDCVEVAPFDLKGKRPKKEGGRISVCEVGESSCPHPSESDAYCSICMESKSVQECFPLEDCSHVYCASCISLYVEAKVAENITAIGCPDPSCKDGYLELEMCRFILKPEVFNRWGAALCEAMIGSRKFYCPFNDCSALLIDERGASGEEAIKQSECPHCYRLFCAQCKVPWHVEMSCEDFIKLEADERGRDDMLLRNLAKNSNWQRCPKCKFYVERISGCMFINCR